jgi:hypothetical protein
MIVTTKLCNVSELCSNCDSYAKNKVICALHRILRVTEAGRALSDWLPHTSSKDASYSCIYIDIKGRVNSQRL